MPGTLVTTASRENKGMNRNTNRPYRSLDVEQTFVLTDVSLTTHTDMTGIVKWPAVSFI